MSRFSGQRDHYLKANTLAQNLSQLGFEVEFRENLTLAQLKAVLDDFLASVQPNSLAVLVFVAPTFEWLNRPFLCGEDCSQTRTRVKALDLFDLCTIISQNDRIDQAVLVFDGSGSKLPLVKVKAGGTLPQFPRVVTLAIQSSQPADFNQLLFQSRLCPGISLQTLAALFRAPLVAGDVRPVILRPMAVEVAPLPVDLAGPETIEPQAATEQRSKKQWWKKFIPF
jgi:hypothetical protein